MFFGPIAPSSIHTHARARAHTRTHAHKDARAYIHTHTHMRGRQCWCREILNSQPGFDLKIWLKSSGRLLINLIQAQVSEAETRGYTSVSGSETHGYTRVSGLGSLALVCARGCCFQLMDVKVGLPRFTVVHFHSSDFSQ